MANPKILWEGSQLAQHSLAHVNREICSRIRHAATLSLTTFEGETPKFFSENKEFFALQELYNKFKNSDADIVIRHQWPPRFSSPQSGYWIMMQPWEFGFIPKEWVRPMTDSVDEIWAYSNYVKQCYIDSGIPAEKITLMPLGIDTKRFTSDAQAYTLQTKKKFKFLFIGGTIWRKGIDRLLEVYTKTFSASDDVCLVIKDMCGSSFYKGMNAGKQIQELMKDSNNPEIEYITDNLSDAEIAGLYTASDCLLQPYRGEGFGLPVAEAMASGLPVIVTAGGSTDDFCPDDLVYKIRSEKILVNMEFELVDQGWALQPDAKKLAGLMLHVIDNPEEAQQKAQLAADHIRSKYNWEICAENVIDRLNEINMSKAIPKRTNSLVKQTKAKGTDSMDSSQIARADYQKLEDLFKRGVANFKEGNYSEALKLFSELLDGRPQDFQASQYAAESAIRTGNDSQARKILTDAVASNPKNANLINLLGVFLAQRNEIEEAAKMFKKAILLTPDDLDTLSNLIEISLQLREYEEVVKYCDKILDIEQGNVSITLAKGNALALSGYLEESLTLYKGILERDSSNKEAIENIAIVENAINKSMSLRG